jgi:hypothetical protein
MLGEEITSSDTTILVIFDSKVKQFFITSICDTFDELILHHDVCLISFSEMRTWIKESIECLWKAWRMKYVDWGPNPCPPYVSPTGPPCHFSPKERKR